MLRRLAWTAALLAGALLVFAFAWIQLHRTDLPEPGDEDLVQSRRPPASSEAGESGFDALGVAGEAGEGLDDPELSERLRAMRERRAWDGELAADLLRRNRPALEALERALAAPPGLIPRAASGTDASEKVDPRLFRLLQLVKLGMVEAQRLRRSGEQAAAFERGMLGLRAGRWLSEAANAGLVPMMLALGSQSVSLQELEALVQETPLGRSQARQLASRIDSQRIRAVAWRRVWAEEYRGTKALLAEVLEPRPDAVEALGEVPLPLRWLPADYLLQPNRTLAGFAAFYRQRQEEATRPCLPGAASASSPDVSILRLVLAPNPVGRILLEVGRPDYARFEQRRCHHEAKLDLVRVAIAARAHALEHGAPPDRLDALVPDYLEAIPPDPFGDAPLRYAKDEAVAYSIGADYVDSGGAPPPSLGNEDEPGVPVRSLVGACPETGCDGVEHGQSAGAELGVPGP